MSLIHTKKVDYGLKDGGVGLKYLKLHGSLNWRYCKNCKKVIPLLYLPIKTAAHIPVKDGPHIVQFIPAGETTEPHICGFDHLSDLVIVPPTLNKAEHQNQIKGVWNVAANELSRAEDIYICGYSLPETDMFFRYLYALGTLGKSRIKKLWVYDIDESDNFKRRYENLLGPLVKEGRLKFKVPYNFSSALKHIGAILDDEVKHF